MNIERFKQRLVELEKDLSTRMNRDLGRGRAQLTDVAVDAGDAGAANESASEDFTEAELDSTVLAQIRDALRRIDNGTFGACLADGGPIDAKRLEAVPWAPYCLKHQKLFEAASRLRTPTL